MENKIEIKTICRAGFSLTELMVATLMTTIIMSGVGIVLVDGHKAWNAMYNMVYSDLAVDSHVARRTFDSIIRMSSKDNVTVVDGNEGIEARYYTSSTEIRVNRYAYLHLHGTGPYDLVVEYGDVTYDGTGQSVYLPGQAPSGSAVTGTICGNVSSCVFKTAGDSAQMILTLDNIADVNNPSEFKKVPGQSHLNSRKTRTIVTSAMMHNE